MATYVLVALIVFSASLLQAYLGFGFALIAMALLPLMFDYTMAVALNTGIAIVATIYMSVKYRKNIRWKVLLPLLIPSLIIGALVTAFSFRVDPSWMFILLGVMLIALAVYNFLFSKKIQIKPTVLNGTLMGLVCGVCNGFFSIGGPTAALYLLPATETKEGYFATIQAFFAACNTVNLTVRIAKGSFSGGDWKLLILGWVFMLAGSLVGQKIFRKAGDKKFASAVYIFIAINGAWLIFSHI